MLSDGYVSGIVAHLSKDELEKYDREHGGLHPELQSTALDSQGKFNWIVEAKKTTTKKMTKKSPNNPFLSVYSV